MFHSSRTAKSLETHYYKLKKQGRRYLNEILADKVVSQTKEIEEDPCTTESRPMTEEQKQDITLCSLPQLVNELKDAHSDQPLAIEKSLRQKKKVLSDHDSYLSVLTLGLCQG